MNTGQTRVLPGDKLTVTITGTVADPAKASTANGNTTLKIHRPSRATLIEARLLPQDVRRGIRVDTVFGPDVNVEFTVTSQFKNGVHIDAAGHYWMRTPEGWFEMQVSHDPATTTLGEFVPKDVRRLMEDRES